ncbi:MAG: hypothetical protein QXI32_06190, partial [Candidatus Bathyarchaeia archaeon]
MHPATKLTAVILALLLAPISSIVAVGAEVPYGPYPDKFILFLQPSEDAVVPMIEKGEMQTWLYFLRKPENVKRATDSPKIDVLKTYASS